MARLYRVANRVRFRWDTAGHGLQAVVRDPGTLIRLIQVPRLVRRLGDPETWLEVHREVQGDRLFSHRRPATTAAIRPEQAAAPEEPAPGPSAFGSVS